MSIPAPIEKLLAELASLIPQAEKINTNVSAASVSWHLSHSLKVMASVGTNLQKTDPAEYKPIWNIKKFIGLQLKYFPRGRAKAPKYVVPEKEYTEQELRAFIEDVKQIWENVTPLPKNAFIKHHHFGPLNKSKAIRFVGIHTNHHIKIIKEVIGKR
ncbi:MAG: hypothetical protein K2X26_14230 [Chitinophagaceae bacterium]|nr:hypothetical protein [Chitinophagaceae bacterium]